MKAKKKAVVYASSISFLSFTSFTVLGFSWRHKEKSIIVRLRNVLQHCKTSYVYYDRAITLNVSNTLQIIILTNIAVIFRPCISTYLFQCIPPWLIWLGIARNSSAFHAVLESLRKWSFTISFSFYSTAICF